MKPLRALLVIALSLPPLLAVALAWYSYNSTIDNAFASGERTAAVLREHALRVLKAQETAINWIDARLEGISWEEIENSRQIHEFLQQVKRESEHIDGIWLVPPDGTTVNSADFFPMPNVDARDRDYYRVLKERDITHIGEMIEGKLKGNLNFNISRRRTTPDGSFDGLILVTASLGYLDAFWRATLESDRHSVALLRADGSILARYPAVVSVPERLPDNFPFYVLTGAQASGSYAFRSATDNRQRLYSYAKLGDYPAYIVVGLDREGVLAPWKFNAIVMGCIAALGMLLLGLVVRRAQRHENRLAAEIQRRQVAENAVIEKSEHLKAMQIAEEALRNSEQRLLAALDAGQMGTFRLELSTGKLDLYESMRHLFGLPDGRDLKNLTELLSVIHADDRGRVREALEREHENGDTVKLEFRVVNSDQHLLWFYARGRAHGDAQGRAAYLTGACVDITSRKEAEERRKLISAELDHRVRNTLASIQSILRLTEHSAQTKEKFSRAVTGRVQAMARAHGHLTDSGWRGAGFRALIGDELRPYVDTTDPRVEIAGTDLLLKPAAAVSMALVVHELTTNAVKYGALSTPDGRLAIRWKTSEAEEAPETLHFEWVECNGPRVRKPRRKGFGSRMLQRILEHEFGATVTLEFPPEGHRFTASFPLDKIVRGVKGDSAVLAEELPLHAPLEAE